MEGPNFLLHITEAVMSAPLMLGVNVVKITDYDVDSGCGIDCNQQWWGSPKDTGIANGYGWCCKSHTCSIGFVWFHFVQLSFFFWAMLNFHELPMSCSFSSLAPATIGRLLNCPGRWFHLFQVQPISQVFLKVKRYEKIEKAVDDPETQKCPAAGPLRKMGGTARGSGVSAESSVWELIW